MQSPAYLDVVGEVDRSGWYPSYNGDVIQRACPPHGGGFFVPGGISHGREDTPATSAAPMPTSADERRADAGEGGPTNRRWAGCAASPPLKKVIDEVGDC
jgi:hypothetical protein